MKSLWNCLVLDRPPTATWSPGRGEFDIPQFLHVINKILKDLWYQEPLHTEAALLSRLIYRMKWKFRSDKGLKNMEKTNRALRNYLQLSIENEFVYLKDNVDVEKPCAVPSRQILEYVLIRIQGFAKLMCRVETVARTAAEFLKCRINIGQAWVVATIAYSVVSRIWLMSRYLVKKACHWYDSLYQFLPKMKLVGVKWMPEDQSLPSNLNSWLDLSWIDEPIQCISETDTSDSIFRLIKANDHDDVVDDFPETEEPMIVEEVKSEEAKLSPSKSEEGDDPPENVVETPEIKKINCNPLKNVVKTPEIREINFNAAPDIGEKISRESFKPQVKLNKVVKKEKSKKNKIKSKEDIAHLLKLDSYPGLDKLQWKMLKKIISKILIKLEKCPVDSPKHKLLIEKVVRSIQDCVS